MNLKLYLIASVVMAAGSAAGAAPSHFGCKGLETAKPMATLEGKDGVFFRLNLDMRMNHPLSQQTAAMIGRISDALAEKGTTLIYIPVPTKSLAMPDNLPDSVADYGFDLQIAETAYQDFLDNLSAHGVTAIDSVKAMRGVDGDAFLATDFHWSPEGSRSVARAAAAVIRDSDGYGDIEKTNYVNIEGETHLRFSEMRNRIQAYCRESVPRVEIPHYETSATSQADVSGGIFAADSAGPPIALTGTSMSAEEDFNFAGFLAEASGAAVADYAITGGNQFGGITSYLLSEDFHNTKPAYVIWENPIYNNVGEFGETPLRELMAAATQNCEPVKTSNPSPGTLVADLNPETLPEHAYVRVDTGAPTGRQAQFHFISDDGLDVAATITRPVRYDATRWFYQYAEPLWSANLAQVRVDLDQPAEAGATLAICTTKETSS